MPATETWSLFAYGTLMTTGSHHALIKDHLRSLEPASVRGRLYRHPTGYPVVAVPKEDHLLNGSSDLASDLSRGSRELLQLPLLSLAIPEWSLVTGELLRLPQSLRLLKKLDDFEGYHPAQQSLYSRTLIPVQTQTGLVAAWCYIAAVSPSPGLIGENR